LVAGGIFSEAGGADVKYVSRYHRENWGPLNLTLDGPLHAVTLYHGRLIVGGDFEHADGIAARSVAAWDGSEWSALGGGLEGPVYDLAVFRGALFAGGDFDLSDSTQVRNLARWDGNAWTQVGSGANAAVQVLKSEPTRLLVGGDFTSIDGRASSRVAAFDGGSWTSFGTGLPGTVRALQTFQDTLIAGGDFDSPEEQGDLHHVAEFVDDVWRTRGSGLDGAVLTLAEYQGRLLAGGSFANADTVPTPGLAAWDSTGWVAYAPDLNGSVDRLFVHGPSLYVGGDFQITATDGSPVSYLVRLREGIWASLGSGVDGPVESFAAYDQDLYLGGSFLSAGARPSPFIARWFDLDPVPVHLRHFEAQREGSWVRLRWGVGSAIEHAGFYVYRGDPKDGVRLPADLILPTEDGEHEILDRDAPSGEVPYWLEEISTQGTGTLFGPVFANPAHAAPAASFDRIWPSPFRSRTSIRFTLGRSESVTLFVHDTAGRRVATLIDGPLPAGPHEVQWNGRDQDGRRLPPGLYFMSLSGQGWNESGRALLLR
ncbi:MAG: hypothetical protein KC729_19760, partial [Candidatus Eisenbacteria bacterium]|nr:hypothetical protein [Candidatus Eisenbacteria bacterium]